MAGKLAGYNISGDLEDAISFLRTAFYNPVNKAAMVDIANLGELQDEETRVRTIKKGLALLSAPFTDASIRLGHGINSQKAEHHRAVVFEELVSFRDLIVQDQDRPDKRLPYDDPLLTASRTFAAARPSDAVKSALEKLSNLVSEGKGDYGLTDSLRALEYATALYDALKLQKLTMRSGTIRSMQDLVVGALDLLQPLPTNKKYFYSGYHGRCEVEESEFKTMREVVDVLTAAIRDDFANELPFTDLSIGKAKGGRGGP